MAEIDPSTAPLSIQKRIDIICDRFEQEWQAQRRPRIEDHVADESSEERPHLLRALLAIDVEFRRRLGEEPRMEEYADRFPDLSREVLVRTFDGPKAPSLADSEQRTVPEVPRDSPARIHVPGYHVGGCLGRGGMGVVYEAVQERLRRTVALKVMRGEVGEDERNRIRFLAEAEAVAAISHPHVVQVFECGQVQDQPYLVMELLVGGTLASQLTQQGRFSGRQAATLLEKVARGVQAAHEQGIIHRDLKPANILFDQRGEPKVTDFGLAKRRTGAVLTQPEAVLGTPAYMAPEQASGRASFVGPAADVWALGVMLYQMLTGVLPFHGEDTLSLLRNICERDPIPCRHHASDIPRDLEFLCLKCLAKEPADRYSTALALAEDLGRFLEGRPVKVRPLGPMQRAWRWSRRNQALAAAGTVILGLLLCLAGGGLWFGHTQALRAEEQRLQQRAAAREAATLALDRGIRLCEDGSVGTGLLWLASALETLPDDNSDIEEVIRRNIAAWRPRLAELQCVLPLDAPLQSAMFSVDGRYLATGSTTDVNQVWDTATGRPVGPPLSMDRPDPRERVRVFAFHPDGKRLATVSRFRPLQIWDIGTGKLLEERPHPLFDYVVLVYSPDGQRLVAAGSDKVTQKAVLSIWDERGNPLAQLSDPKQSRIRRVRFLSEREVLVQTLDNVDFLCSVSGEPPPVLRPLRLGPLEPRNALFTFRTLTLGGELKAQLGVLAETSGHGRFLCDLEGPGETAPTFRQSTMTMRGQAMAASLLADGRGMLVGRLVQDLEIRPWFVHFPPSVDKTLGATGFGVLAGEARSIPGEPTLFAYMEHPPATWVLTTGATARVWRVAAGDRPPAVASHPLIGLSVAPDGRTFATCGGLPNGGRLSQWEIATLTEQATFKDHTKEILVVAYSPDGRFLTTAGYDSAVRIYQRDAAGRFQLAHSPPKQTSFVGRIAISDDSKTLATADDNGAVALWDLATGQKTSEPFHLGEPPGGMVFLPGEQKLLVGPMQGRMLIWDGTANAPQPVARLEAGSLRALARSVDGQTLATTAGGDRTVQLWTLAEPLVPGRQLSVGGNVTSMVFSPEGSRLLVCTAKDRERHAAVRVWDLATGKALGPPREHSGYGVSAAFLGSERFLSVCDAGQIELTPVPPSCEGKPASVRTEIESCTGMALRSDGGTQLLSVHPSGDPQ